MLIHPGATWSTADVEAGLRYGLQQLGVEVIAYRLDERIEQAGKYLWARWRQLKKSRPDLPKPSQADMLYQASVGVLEMALRKQVDVVLIVSAMLFHPDVIVMMKQVPRFKVTVLFTESPYDHDEEVRVAAMVDGCWTNERTCVADFRRVNPAAGYLPHGWHPLKHGVDTTYLGAVPAHDVVFVGSGFAERVDWFNAIDWTGINLGLYGTWKGLGLKKSLLACVAGAQVENQYAAALYQRAKIGLNLYRTHKGWGRNRQRITTTAESLSPRAYELAACGAFHLSDSRAEVREVFGDLVPTFTTPTEAAALIRLWLADPAGRARVAAALPAAVAEASWTERAKIVLGDLQTLLNLQAA
jgi:spore maturation protein CgeB